MTRAVPTLLIGLFAFTAAACQSDEKGTTDNQPFVDDWRTEAFVPFDWYDEDAGMAAIFSLQVGGRLAGGTNNPNFANRGDVIVLHDGAPDTITIEFQRFTFAPNQDAADETFEAMSLWAFNTSVDQPQPPDAMDPEAQCVLESGWQSGCGIRLYYDGLSQLARAGANIRVTLPPDYARDLTVITEDNDADPDYFNRGNVCIDGLQGNATVRLQSGQAFVKVAPDASIAPQCSADFIQQCNDWPCVPNSDDACDGSEAWDSNCPCVSQVGEFGRVLVESHDAASADINIDVPSDLWMSITAKNEQMGQDSSDPELHCRATVDVPGYEIFPEAGNDFPWETRGQINYPSSNAVSGAGYNVTAFSKGCNPVPATEGPEDFVGVGNGTMQESTQRGNIRITSGALTQSCDELLPG